MPTSVYVKDLPWQPNRMTGILGVVPIVHKLEVIGNHPIGLEIVGDCALEHYGLAAIGGGAILAGAPILEKPRSGISGGGKSGNYTSMASKLLRRLFPNRLTRFGLFGTRVLGGVIGRMASYAGWALLAADVLMIVDCAYKRIERS
ncbi:MAG: hypothetical protein EP347_01935 [Alphaproteobacteria bacterium]|nr:MAG: hypothetical protein EP347_01935 [Alphaproteobacteria bacterium]